MPITRRPGAYTCGLDATLSVLNGKWKMLILWPLSERPHRFGELRREVRGVTEKVLTTQLRELEADGIVHREVYDEVPPRVEYSLTPLVTDSTPPCSLSRPGDGRISWATWRRRRTEGCRRLGTGWRRRRPSAESEIGVVRRLLVQAATAVGSGAGPVWTPGEGWSRVGRADR
ncbi:winged helix-turn-helix transcriptional regulator [Nocardia puris]|uniref:winged helix-turn-helix transcriptional regulator n=1 Tax=Nocardia puris TaxID=208602 RepID=UPI000DEAA0F6|nr:helix-turn-helix domain-containing protein [Nocardia puris]